jgi:ATP-dependent DNA helicase RecG
LTGIGGRVAERLARLGIHSVQDLLFHLPFRYQDRTRVSRIGALRPGDEATVEGEVQLSEVRRGRRRMLLVYLSDGSGALLLRFFHFSVRQQETLARGVRLRCFGEVRGNGAMPEMVHPEYRLLRGVASDHGAGRHERSAPDGGEATLTPVYPTTAGLHQAVVRNVIAQALTLITDARGEDFLPELLPPEVGSGRGYPSLRDALLILHRPSPGMPIENLIDGSHPACKRIAFEELVAHQVSLLSLRAAARHHRAPPLNGPGELLRRFTDSLPFALTDAQRRVIDEIAADLRTPRPMQRLVQGDVGSGKTVVAVAAVLLAVEAGYQAALMAPTELLAEQHHRTVRAWLEPLGIEVCWLAGKAGAKERERTLGDLRSGKAQVAVGTHALFQDQVEFASLGLVIIDEQHRFGVHQRLSLREKGRNAGRYPHQLIMTATPIPRTLMMTAYADLDASVIDQLPPGRVPVSTAVIPDTRRDEVLRRVRSACAEGRQVYWVCTLIEESEALQCQTALDTAQRLREALPGLDIGLVHGRLKPADKDAVMSAFKRGELHVLVATTVIEVGVDVPNASLMIIENAERLGLAQLHQLRGRVGRGSRKSACVMMYHSPLSERGRQRLAVLRDTTDGFEIARRDLELRGPGEILGVRQAGTLNLRRADLVRDADLVAPASETARIIRAHYPELAGRLTERWLAGASRYGTV